MVLSAELVALNVDWSALSPRPARLPSTSERNTSVKRDVRYCLPVGPLSWKPYVQARSTCPMTASGPSGLASAACGRAATNGFSPSFGSELERSAIAPRYLPMSLSWPSQTSYELVGG